MFSKAFVFVTLVCFIQATRGDDIADLIKELTPKIKAAAVRIANVTVDGGAQVKDAFIEIQQDLNGYEKDLATGKVNLFKAVHQAVVDARKSGKDIGKCVSDVIAAAKDLAGWQFEACRINKELNDLTVDLAALAKREASLLASPVKCTVSSGGDLDKLKTCVLDIIDEVNKQADDVEAEVEPSVTAGVKNAKQCGADRSAELTDLINSVTNNFNDCVSKA